MKACPPILSSDYTHPDRQARGRTGAKPLRSTWKNSFSSDWQRSITWHPEPINIVESYARLIELVKGARRFRPDARYQLRLALRRRTWMGIDTDPFQFSPSRWLWSAAFRGECVACRSPVKGISIDALSQELICRAVAHGFCLHLNRHDLPIMFRFSWKWRKRSPSKVQRENA